MVNFNPIDKGYIVRLQSDLVYTIESVRPVVDKPYHMNNGFQQMWPEISKLWNHSLPLYPQKLERNQFCYLRLYHHKHTLLKTKILY